MLGLDSSAYNGINLESFTSSRAEWGFPCESREPHDAYKESFVAAVRDKAMHSIMN